MRMNSTDYRNNWRDYVRQLAELNSSYSESTYVDIFINQIDHNDYLHTVETINAIPNYTLKDCYHAVNAKSQDIEYPKP